jgi:glycosyltransferase involved in cell wall biosynthesis
MNPEYINNLKNIIGEGNIIKNLHSPATASASASASAVATSQLQQGRKVKFMLVSTHCQQYTGYSKVSYGILRQLAKVPWLDVTHFAFQKFENQQFAEGYRPYPANVKLIDAVAEEKPLEQGFGFKQLPDAIRKVQPDIVMIFNDMSIVGKFITEIEKSGIPRTFKVWVYCDQVYNTQLNGYLEMLNLKAERIFAFTSYWRQCLRDQGVTRPVDVLLHGFDSDVYKPLPRDEIRKNMKIPTDAFVFLNVNRNQPRKRYDILVMAFVELLVKYPTKMIFLLCVCDKGDKGGWWLFEIFQRELRMRGVPVEQYGGRLMVSTQDLVFKDEDINVFYNMANAGVNSADGEGWGLCNFEQMGVGVPQVVPKLGGFREFCNTDNSILIEPKNRYYLPMVYSPVGGEAFAMDPHDLCMGLEEYVLDSEKLAKHGEAAMKTALSYTWERAVAPLIRRLQQEKEDLDAEV